MLTQNTKELITFSSKHHTYHYQEAYEHFLISFVYTKLQNKQNALKHIEKSFFHLPHNNHLAQFLQSFVNVNLHQEKQYLTILQETNDEISIQNGELILKNKLHNKFGIYSTDVERMLQQVDELFIKQDYQKLEHILIQINNHTAQKHFDYHCQLADMYFEIAKEHFAQNAIQDAKYFIHKALETDKRNPNNEKYKQFELGLKDII